MKIILGLFLDQGYHFPIPENTGNIGLAINGPVAFLGLLETIYGIPPLGQSNAVRISQYEKILDENNSADSFYHDSFKLDSFGAAQKLLTARDEILLSTTPEFQMEMLLQT